jgi:glycosyltransferase involved in cell wall biosynthesis
MPEITSPILSIVTPTRGNFSPNWLEKLLQVEGEVQFILVYPPSAPIQPIADPRVTSLVSPYKGEMMQRFVGLLNAKGQYVIALDDDDLIHPGILSLAVTYFQRFPSSWMLRLSKNVIDFRQVEQIHRAWDTIPDVEALEICRKTPENPHPYQGGQFTGLLEVPVAPLTTPLNWQAILLPFVKRLDNHGYHFENFNNIVWRHDLVQAALVDLGQTTRWLGAITWIPTSGFDRLLGLYTQAKHFSPQEQSQIIGHWMPGGEQIRFIDKPATVKPPRFHVISDLLLVKRFPQYGYCWNLFFEKLYKVPHTAAKALKLKVNSGKLKALKATPPSS